MSRISLFPGKGSPQTFTLTADTKVKLATLAEAARCSRSDFVEGLVRSYGPQLVAELLAAGEGDDANDDQQADEGGGNEGPGGCEGGERVAAA